MSNLFPMDKYNKKLLENVHPKNWKNPEPAKRYNLVVIGAGTAGLVAASGAAGLGAKVALIERDLMGGDCLNVGCVPSKVMLRSSTAAADVASANRFGVGSSAAARANSVNFADVMERMRSIRARISSNDSAKRFTDEFGVDVFIGDGKFVGKDTIDVNGSILKFKKAVITTGARSMIPPIEGLHNAGFLTNETVFNLTKRPKHLAVIGGGPIGCELSQAFRRLGSQVTIIEMASQFLIREDKDAADLLADAFEREGIKVLLDAKVEKVTKKGGKKILYVLQKNKIEEVIADEILVGAGRVPNVEGLNLEMVGVEHDRFGITVNDNLKTTNPRILAAGDVAIKYKFTHSADFSSRIVIQNALFFGRKKISALTVPWVTYTDPEIAHVGMYERDAVKRGIEVETFKVDFSDIDRAIVDGEEDGFVKIHVKKGTDKILGGTIVGHHAGDMISEITIAMATKLGLGALASVIHPYPTRAEAIRRLGDVYNRTRLTPTVKKFFKKWLSLGL
jgi:pyruvate/2-oxoglutarate dehydrogenase complex dihydrolipoamide dehydrogenase (E3) component